MSREATDWLRHYLNQAPAALALLRAIECRELSRQVMEPPLIDLGCGDGLTAKLLGERTDHSFSVGLDHSIPALRAAQDNQAHALLLRSDITDIPIQKHSASTLLSNCVLEHVHDLSKALAEARRILKPGGRLIFTVPTARCSSELTGTALLRRVGLGDLARSYAELYDRRLGHLHLYDLDGWEGILSSNGFELVAHQAYASPIVLRLHDLMTPLGLPSLIWRRLTGRLAVSKYVRRRLVAPVMARLLRRPYQEDGADGCSLLIVARAT